QSYSQSAFIGKPFGHHGYRRRVAKAVAEPAYHPEAHVQVSQAVRKGAQEETQADQNTAGQGNPEWTVLVLQPSRRDKRQGEDDNSDGVHHGSIRPLPAEFF